MGRKTGLHTDTAFKIAQYFNVTLDFLLGKTEEEDPTMFRIRLKELREKAGYSQYSFAEKFGVSQSTVENWEAGAREPNFDTMQRLADFFGVSVNYLLGRESKSIDTKKELAHTERTLSDVLKDYADPDTETLLLFGHGLPMQEIKVKKEDMEIVRGLVDALKKKYDTEK